MSGVARRVAALGLLGLAAAFAVPPAGVAALTAPLSAADVEQALQTGTKSVTEEEFGEEWRVRLPGGEEIQVTTPFSRLAHAARRAALRQEPLTDKQRQEQVDRGKDRIQFLVTMYGRAVDFPRFYQPVLRVGDREVKASFTQNERTALRLPDGRFAARNVYAFPLEGVPSRGTVTLVVRSSVDNKEVLRASVDLSKMR